MKKTKTGAGVIPFCAKDGRVFFLFHKTFSGRRAGLLIDFGGGAKTGEGYRETAMREFIEETETMFLSEDIENAALTESRMEAQLMQLERIFDKTLSDHPDWWSPRGATPSGKFKDWRTFFVEFDYRDPAAMNLEWRNDGGRRFSKRRELVWVASDELIEICRNARGKLWRRVRELTDMEKIVESIVSEKTKRSPPDSGWRSV